MKIKIQKRNIVNDMFQSLLYATTRNDPNRYYFRLFGYDVFVVFGR